MTQWHHSMTCVNAVVHKDVAIAPILDPRWQIHAQAIGTVSVRSRPV